VTNTFTAIGIVTGALISLGIVLRPAYKRTKEFFAWVERFMRDWEGEEYAPGRDRVPGVMERLNKLDGELSQNGGKSTKDTVNKLLKNQEKVVQNQDMMIEAFVEMGERLIAIENFLTNKETETPK
jgi:hypothetical protein